MSEATKGEPQHEHDCSSCVFLGRHGEFDLYMHPSAEPVLRTVIARFGPDGDYLSGLCFAKGDSPLAEALRRAMALGFDAALSPVSAELRAISADLAEDAGKAERRFAMQYRVAVEEQAQMWRDNGGM